MKYADKSTNFKHLVNGVILAKLTDAEKEFHLFITLLQKKNTTNTTSSYAELLLLLL